MFFLEISHESRKKDAFFVRKTFKMRDFTFKMRDFTHFKHQITISQHQLVKLVVLLQQKKILMVKVYG